MTKITFVGCGNMAQAMISGLRASKQKFHIYVIEKNEELKNKIQKKLKVEIVDNLDHHQTNIVILSVKPKDVAEACKNLNVNGSIVISIAAGIGLDTIKQHLKGYQKLVRVMPNLNAFEGKSINTIYFDDLIESEDRKIIGSIFSSIGQNIIFDDELMIDQSTAISGSGPAYVFYLMQSFIEAATKIGLPLEDAKKLVYETFAGACATAKKNLDDLDKLIENVSSQGGTTEAAIKSFDESNIKEIFNQAVKNAYNRALEINQENKN